MKVSSHIGHLGLTLFISVLVSSCNKSEFFKAEEFLVGKDAQCFEDGPDLASCLQMPDECQPAYKDSADESFAPEFMACLANPDYVDPGDTTGGTDGGSVTGGTDGGSATGGTDGGSSTGGTDGGSATGGTDGGSSAGGSAGGTTTGGVVSEPPTLDETVKAKCLNLDEKYLWTKKIVKDKKVSYSSKVKVCHMTGNDSSHTILIACPALKAHVKHHDDYIGVCIQE